MPAAGYRVRVSTTGEVTGWLAERHPDVDFGAAVVVEQGWNFQVVDTGEWVFRLPRRPEIGERLPMERRLLDALAPRLPVPVPRYRVLGALPDGRTPYVGYRRLPGTPLPELSGTGLQQVAGCIAALQDVSLREAAEIGVPGDPGDWRPAYEEWAAEVERRTLPTLAPKAAAQTRSLLRTVLDLAPDDGTPVLVHGDLRPMHVLHDPARGVVTGIIDWSAAAIGDPALDLAGFAATLGPGQTRCLAEALPAPRGDPTRVERALAWAAVEPVYELHFGLMHEAPEQIANGLRRIAGITA